MDRKAFIIIAVLVIGLGVLLYTILFGSKNSAETVKRVQNIVTGSDGFSINETTPGYENYKKLEQGCPFIDCIPSIDDPKFESISEADVWLDDEDLVFVVKKEEVRVYPQKILNLHEIVNDNIGDIPIVVSFCPLCGSALAFERKVEGVVLEFGVSGKLHNNDLVMYDRQTKSLWQQITGEAIVGELYGTKLEQISMGTLTWENLKRTHDNAEVLSRDTGSNRNYDVYPYGNYESNERVSFGVEGGVDTTLHPKAVIFGVEVDGVSKAYPEGKLQAEGKIQDTLGVSRVEVSYNNGDVRVVRIGNSEEIPATRMFWFAWKAFRPDTRLY